ncbi:MAG TPA: hypothetical protein VGA59_06600 [Ramlibacter sp.]
MRALVILAAVLMLGACASRHAAREHAACLSYGLTPELAGYADCRLALAQQRQAMGLMLMGQGLATLSAANRPVYRPPVFLPPMRLDCTSIAQGAFVNTSCR